MPEDLIITSVLTPALSPRRGSAMGLRPELRRLEAASFACWSRDYSIAASGSLSPGVEGGHYSLMHFAAEATRHSLKCKPE